MNATQPVSNGGKIRSLPIRKIRAITQDPVQGAKVIHLVYVSDQQPGIERRKRGKYFYYYLDNKKLNDEDHLQRIKKLAIPPAWQEVWICTLPNGHLQATGFDIKKRKQYRYHSDWNQWRNQTKFYRLYEFGKALPGIREQLEKDLALPGLPLEKVLALAVSLMERTTIRVGNSQYEKLYGSFGITTLKDNHVEVSGSQIKFKFKGKKGIHHAITLKSKRLANLVRKCRDIPGKELFQYYDEAGTAHSIDSGMVNEYIRKISGSDYSSKDFRTWAGTVKAFLAFKEIGPVETETKSEMKRKISEALQIVSQYLGNTVNVCRKYYVHPELLSLYERNGLTNYLNSLDHAETKAEKDNLTPEEKILIKIFKQK